MAGHDNWGGKIMTRFMKLSSVSCMAAALSMAATPALAAEFAPGTGGTLTAKPGLHWDSDAGNAQRYRHWRDRDRVDAGDILAGILIIGGIAAIADAASKPRNAPRYPENDARYRQPANARSSDSGSGIDRAVDMCVNEIERDVRVDSVDGASRNGSGWNVTGTLYNGDGFSCQIDNRGQIADISYGGKVAVTQDRQWDDERYRAAREQIDSTGAQDAYEYAQVEPQPAGPQPAYPGGPIDGDIPQDGELGG